MEALVTSTRRQSADYPVLRDVAPLPELILQVILDYLAR